MARQDCLVSASLPHFATRPEADQNILTVASCSCESSDLAVVMQREGIFPKYIALGTLFHLMILPVFVLSHPIKSCVSQYQPWSWIACVLLRSHNNKIHPPSRPQHILTTSSRNYISLCILPVWAAIYMRSHQVKVEIAEINLLLLLNSAKFGPFIIECISQFLWDISRTLMELASTPFGIACTSR